MTTVAFCGTLQRIAMAIEIQSICFFLESCVVSHSFISPPYSPPRPSIHSLSSRAVQKFLLPPSYGFGIPAPFYLLRHPFTPLSSGLRVEPCSGTRALSILYKHSFSSCPVARSLFPEVGKQPSTFLMCVFFHFAILVRCSVQRV